MGRGYFFCPELGCAISIHPSRVGWDGDALAESFEWVKISIHPSRVGWDRKITTIRFRSIAFQSTHPVWDGTYSSETIQTGKYISIHPSRVGWDYHSTFQGIVSPYFNPPIPCGMGLYRPTSATSRKTFQSTHPVWDGTEPIVH